MWRGNLISYTVLYSFRCQCGTSNSGSMEIEAPTEYAALQQARARAIPCNACSSISLRQDLKAHVELLSF